MPIKKVIVTGSSGTIGTRLCETLLERGYEVVGADWRPNAFSPVVQAITTIVDLRDKAKTIELLPKDFDLIVHLAANARVYDLVVEPDRARDNFETIFNVLEHARQSGIKRFMFASSREVYGNLASPVHTEDHASIDACESPYTASKIAGEALAHAYRRCYGIESIIFRFSNVYGMYDESDRFVPLMIRKLAGEPVTIFGEDKTLDFTYIDDTVAGIIGAIERFDVAKNETYNIACGAGAKLVDVAKMVAEELGLPIEMKIGQNRTGEVVQYTADCSKAQSRLDYAASTPLREGIRRSVEWYRKWWKL